jgi:D-tyrosyl-tRNA(Tyr) deacylase
MVLVAASKGDDATSAKRLSDKIAGLRIFADADRKMNRAVTEVEGEVLLVSQFTLLADVSKGRRPSFIEAAPGDIAEPLLDMLAEKLRAEGVKVQTGRFGADMQVQLVNDGPVTIIIDC